MACAIIRSDLRRCFFFHPVLYFHIMVLFAYFADEGKVDVSSRLPEPTLDSDIPPHIEDGRLRSTLNINSFSSALCCYP